jgi:hypothetical protein
VAILGAEVYYDDAFVDGLEAVGGFRPYTFQALGDFQIRRNLQVVTGGNPSASRKIFVRRGWASSSFEFSWGSWGWSYYLRVL